MADNLIKQIATNNPNVKFTNCKWLPDSIDYLTIIGSHAYGVATDDSDIDVYGITTPPLNMIFPEMAGHIPGFGPMPPSFNNWTRNDIDHDGKNYDIQIYGLVHFLNLYMQNNPNIVDSMFTNDEFILHQSPIGKHIRDNRKMFLHKGVYYTFKGYADSQMNKLVSMKTSKNLARQASIDKVGYDVKFAYHLVRLLDECEQILTTGDVDLMRPRVKLQSIRNGQWPLKELLAYYSSQRKIMDETYRKSKLPRQPDYKACRDFLMECIEMKYGTVSMVVKFDNAVLGEIEAVLSKYRA